MITREVCIGEKKWMVQLNAQSEVSFAYTYTVKPTLSKFDIGMLRWDERDDDVMASFTEYDYTATDVASEISPVLLKQGLLKAVMSVVHESGKDFFFFQATDEQRARVYRMICREIKRKYPVWNYQFHDDYFYFKRDA